MKNAQNFRPPSSLTVMLHLPMPPAANKMFIFSRASLAFAIISAVGLTIAIVVGLEKRPTDAGEWEAFPGNAKGGGAHFIV